MNSFIMEPFVWAVPYISDRHRNARREGLHKQHHISIIDTATLRLEYMNKHFLYWKEGEMVPGGLAQLQGCTEQLASQATALAWHTHSAEIRNSRVQGLRDKFTWDNYPEHDWNLLVNSRSGEELVREGGFQQRNNTWEFSSTPLVTCHPGSKQAALNQERAL